VTGRARTPLLVIGAGPFGLALAAHARARGLTFMHVGEPMGFWTRHMPAGMLLRSGTDWHLDADGADTFTAYLETRSITPAQALPVTVPLYLDYTRWFMERHALAPLPLRVERLDADAGRFTAHMHDGTTVVADAVVAALGMHSFAHTPPELSTLIPAAARSHTVDLSDPSRLRGRSVLIVGGRQSAYEGAALLAEAGAEVVHVCHRHATPAFETSDWSWVPALVDRTLAEPGWYRALPQPERDALAHRFWMEGRARLEPWLGPRIARDDIVLHPGTNVVACDEAPDESFRVTLDDGTPLHVDHVVMATGYRVDLARVPFLHGVLPRIELRDGAPVLDDTFQSSLPGLYFTSYPVAPQFGPWFGFTVSARTSARILVNALMPGLSAQ
jgi:cation diffusion facilitator CzcD-associated flavoprotein CzcO